MTTTAVILAPCCLANSTAFSAAICAFSEPSVGSRMCLNMMGSFHLNHMKEVTSFDGSRLSVIHPPFDIRQTKTIQGATSNRSTWQDRRPPRSCDLRCAPLVPQKHPRPAHPRYCVLTGF